MLEYIKGLLGLAKTAETVKKILDSPARQVRSMIDAERVAESEGYKIEWKNGNAVAVVRQTMSEMSSDNPQENAEKLRNLRPDWAVHAREAIEKTSEPYMQSLWAKILAGEAEHPGSFSKRTVSIVEDMDKADAELFVAFCQFVWMEGSLGGPYPFPVILDVRHEIYTSQGINHDALANLEAAGLIAYDMSGMSNRYASFYGTVGWDYFDSIVGLTPEKKGDGYYVYFGVASLTKYGEQLLPVCLSLGKVQKNDAFFEYVLGQWKEKGYNPSVAAVVKSEEELLG